MLVLTPRPTEAILIGDDIEVTEEDRLLWDVLDETQPAVSAA